MAAFCGTFRWPRSSEIRNGLERREVESGMYDDDVDSTTRGRIWRVFGAVISMVLVSEYVVLAAGALFLRAVLRLVGEAWRWLLPEREEQRHRARPGADEASA